MKFARTKGRVEMILTSKRRSIKSDQYHRKRTRHLRLARIFGCQCDHYFGVHDFDWNHQYGISTLGTDFDSLEFYWNDESHGSNELEYSKNLPDSSWILNWARNALGKPHRISDLSCSEIFRTTSPRSRSLLLKSSSD